MNVNIVLLSIAGFVCVICTKISKEQHNNSSCTLRGAILACDQDLPWHIPDSITEIYVADYNYPTIKEQKNVFKKTCWKSVKKLDIIVNSRWKFEIFDYDFSDLENLVTLGIHSPTLDCIEKYGFGGLLNLLSLDLSACEYLPSNKIIPPLLTNSSTPKLNTLNLQGLHSLFNGNFLLNEDFLDMITKKKIEKLNLSGCNIFISDYNVFNRDHSLQYLDVSNVTLIETETAGSPTKEYALHRFISNIKTLNVSNIPYRVSSGNLIYTNQHKIITTEECPTWYMNLEEVHASNSFDEPLLMNNFSLNVSECEFNLKKLNFNRNNIIKLNGTIYWPEKHSLELLHLSSCKLTYISPNILKGQFSLLFFDLSNNSLFQMESLPEFQDLLKTLHHLEQLDMSYNKLKHIPYHMFDNNGELSILRLKGNLLDSITFKLTSLVRLTYLDLRQNNIKFIDGLSLTDLKYLSQMALTNASKIMITDFRENPLECSCDSVNFVKWLEAYMKPNMRVESKCTLDGDTVVINKMTVHQTEYLCNRLLIIIISCAVTVILLSSIVLISVIGLKTVRKTKQKRVLKHFVADLNHKNIDENNLIFLSYCSVDGDMVLDNVFAPLDNTLKEMTGLATKLVCHGDTDFRPGMSIISEIMRCVSECCVVIFVVSRAFCASDWCRMEVKEAYEQNKPIILIFKETVEKKMMPGYLQRIFERFTRVKLIQIDGKYELVPSFKSVCESVILLASNRQQEKIQDYKNVQRAQEMELLIIKQK